MSDIEIEKICIEYKIKNFTIKDGLVNVDGDVRIQNKGLTELPLKFGEVSGAFDCKLNRLTSLEGSPTYVGSFFNCYDNHLENLEGGPTYVGDYFDCVENILTSLEGSPRYVGDYFDCGINELTDFKGCPDEVEGYFHCCENKIYNLEGLLFKRIGGIDIRDNIIFDLYKKYNLDDIYHREFLIEADVIRPPDKIGGLPIINKVRMDWFTQTYGLEDFEGDKNYKLE